MFCCVAWPSPDELRWLAGDHSLHIIAERIGMGSNKFVCLFCQVNFDSIDQTRLIYVRSWTTYVPASPLCAQINNKYPTVVATNVRCSGDDGNVVLMYVATHAVCVVQDVIARGDYMQAMVALSPFANVFSLPKRHACIAYVHICLFLRRLRLLRAQVSI